MTKSILDDELLVLLEEQLEEACHYPNCDALRTHLLTCAECPADVNMCELHAAAAKLAKPKVLRRVQQQLPLSGLRG